MLICLTVVLLRVAEGGGAVITYKFGDWWVEENSDCIYNKQSQKHLEPKAFDVLICLLENAGEVVSHATLMQRVWNEQIVENSAIPRNIAHIRRALGDNSKHPSYIETIPKRGYRTLASVERLASQTPNPTNKDSNVILAVLPFDNMSSDADLTYFADGMSEEILLAVSKSTNLQVLGRASSFQFRGNNKAVTRVKNTLGCTHVLDGSVQRSGERLRVTTQLIECRTQTSVWAEHFDRYLTDMFELQNEIAAAVSRALAVAFSSNSHPTGPIDPIAFDLYLQAKASSTQWLGACDAGLLEKSVARAPQFARAWATLAMTRAIEAHVEHDPTRSEPHRRQAIEAASQALRLDPASAAAYTALSIVEPICGRFQERDTLTYKALQAEPTDATED